MKKVIRKWDNQYNELPSPVLQRLLIETFPSSVVKHLIKNAFFIKKLWILTLNKNYPIWGFGNISIYNS